MSTPTQANVSCLRTPQVCVIYRKGHAHAFTPGGGYAHTSTSNKCLLLYVSSLYRQERPCPRFHSGRAITHFHG